MNRRTHIEIEPCVELRRDEVTLKALQIWRAAGRPTGRDLEFWLQAEVEMLAERLEGLADRISFAEAA